MPKSTTDKKLEILIQAVEKLVASPVAPIAPVLPIAPIAPIAPLDNSITQDLIVKFTRLEENVKLNFQQVKDAIKELTDGTSARLGGVEVKSGKNSDDIITIKTQLKVWGIALGIGFTLLQFLINYIKFK